MIARERYRQARRFVEEVARPLDRALLAYHRGEAERDEVLDALAAYQNEDGGFGHGIEPDIRLGASSPMATSVGLEYAVAVGAEASSPLVQRAIGYLLETLEEEGYWHPLGLDVSEAPHAPWWTRSELVAPDAASWANPSAELTGYLFAYPLSVPGETLDRLRRRASEVLAQQQPSPDAPPDLFSLLNWQRALPHLPEPLAARVEEFLAKAWATLQPLTHERLGVVHTVALAPTPESPLAAQYPELVDRLLEAEIAQQGEDGGWWPGWQWGEPELWAQVSREWAGKITVETLLALAAHGKVGR